jgi:predicted acylesterase/phospholipase RssA
MKEEDIFSKFLKSKSKNETLDITYVSTSSKQYLGLTHLDLSFVPNLTYIAGGTFTSVPLSFPNLEIFIINKCPKLYQINIQADKLRELEAEQNLMLTTLKIQSQTLKTLDISYSQKLTEQALDELENSCPKLENILSYGCEKISLFRKHWPRSTQKNIKPEVLNKIKEAYDKKLTELNLYGAYIGSVGAKSLSKNTTLTDLNLYRNNIDDEGAEALAQNRTLLSLNLRENNIGDKGAEALAQNRTLLSLNLWENNIGNVGARAFSQNIALTSLDLENNKIDDEGAKSLLQNEVLISLDLRGNNNIRRETLLLIEKMLLQNKSRKPETITFYVLNEQDKTEIQNSFKKDMEEFRNSFLPFKKATAQTSNLKPHYPIVENCASILSLDGGGYRGLMQAYWLDHLEHELKKPVHRIFDIIAGTSIGGILGMAAVVPDKEGNRAITSKNMISLFKENGHKIFPNNLKKIRYIGKFLNWAYKTVTTPFICQYSPEPLEKLLQGYFGQQKLEKALKNIVVTSVIHGTRTPFLFSSFDDETKDYTMFEACRSTSAATTYFPAFPLTHKTQKIYLADGGLIANNPSNIALSQTMKWKRKYGHNISLENTIMLSLGTGEMPRKTLPINSGYTQVGVILDTTFDGTSALNDHNVENFLLRDNYVRVNHKFDFDIALDNIEASDWLYEASKLELDTIDNFVDGPLRKFQK